MVCVLIVNQHPQGAVLRQPVCTRLHPLGTPREVLSLWDLVGLDAGAVVNAYVVRRIGDDQTSRRQVWQQLQTIAVVDCPSCWRLLVSVFLVLQILHVTVWMQRLVCW